MDTKTKILSNKFIEKLRNGFIIDEKDFNELCGFLETLAVEWKDKKEIDKELVQELYVLPYVTKNMADALSRNGGDTNLVKLIEEKYIKFDNLILECFAL